MPNDLIYTQEERNSKLQIQNFRVYQELRKKMESSIMKQRKALKQSITQYVASNTKPVERNGNSKMRSAGKRIHLNANLTDRKLAKRSGKRSETMRQMPGMLSQEEQAFSEVAGKY